MDLREKYSKVKVAFVVVLALIFISIIIGGAWGFFYVKSSIYSSMSAKSEKVQFSVVEGEGTRKVAEKLEDAGLIKSSWVLIGYMRLSKDKYLLQAGDYVLDRHSSMVEILNTLNEGKVTMGKVTIPEGLTNSQVGKVIVKNGIGTEEDFKKALIAEYDYDFLKNSSSGNLQGFLLPDTYFLSSKPTSQGVVEKMLGEFKDKADSIIKAGAEKRGLSYYQVLILASIVEREVPKSADRRVVAGIFLKRMKIGMSLESCATVQYALGTKKKILSSDDLAVDSPYNTYQIEGLPPTPIANPSLDSIKAVLNPKGTNYLYFFSGKNGKTYFSATNDEHEAKKAHYLY